MSKKSPSVALVTSPEYSAKPQECKESTIKISH